MANAGICIQLNLKHLKQYLREYVLCLMIFYSQVTGYHDLFFCEDFLKKKKKTKKTMTSKFFVSPWSSAVVVNMALSRYFLLGKFSPRLISLVLALSWFRKEVKLGNILGLQDRYYVRSGIGGKYVMQGT